MYVVMHLFVFLLYRIQVLLMPYSYVHNKFPFGFIALPVRYPVPMQGWENEAAIFWRQAGHLNHRIVLLEA